MTAPRKSCDYQVEGLMCAKIIFSWWKRRQIVKWLIDCQQKSESAHKPQNYLHISQIKPEIDRENYTQHVLARLIYDLIFEREKK